MLTTHEARVERLLGIIALSVLFMARAVIRYCWFNTTSILEEDARKADEAALPTTTDLKLLREQLELEEHNGNQKY